MSAFVRERCFVCCCVDMGAVMCVQVELEWSRSSPESDKIHNGWMPEANEDGFLLKPVGAGRQAMAKRVQAGYEWLVSKFGELLVDMKLGLHMLVKRMGQGLEMALFAPGEVKRHSYIDMQLLCACAHVHMFL